MRIERIVITGDVFRTASGDPNQLSNVRWLHEELAPILHELTGLPPKVMYRRNEADGGLDVIAEWYGLLGLTRSVEAWAATFGETSPPQALLDAMRPDYDGALVIGFELSPLMRSVLDGIGAPWINAGVSPIRFLDDLALNLRFSWPAELAHPGLVTPRHVEEAVARMRARYVNDRSARDLDGACVFLAQTRQDRTLIKDAGFFRDGEAIQRVGRALDGRALVLKPHPLAPANPILPALRRRFAARTTGANIYAILAAATDVRFLTISSSAAIEARHFGHTAEMFHPAAHADAGPITSLWAHRSTSFWRSALEPMLPLKATAGIEERATPDRLRRIHGSWGMADPGEEKIEAPTVINRQLQSCEATQLQGTGPDAGARNRALINAFYDSGCADKDSLTTYEREPYRDDPSWIDGAFSEPTMHEPDYAIFRYFQDPTTTILDVGANWGYSVSSMCAAGCLASILSFEPLAWYREHLSRIRQREPRRFDFLISGVGDRDEVLRFVTPVINGVIDSGLTSASEHTHRSHLYRNIERHLRERAIEPRQLILKFIVSEVSVTTLDRLVDSYTGDLSLRAIAAVKIDVEGHEAAVVRGAQQILAQHCPLVMMEGANRLPEVAEPLHRRGYVFATRDVDRLRLFEGISGEANGFFLHKSRVDEYAGTGLLA